MTKVFLTLLIGAAGLLLGGCAGGGVVEVVDDYCDSAELRAELIDFTRPDGALAQKLSADDRERLERIRDWIGKGCELRDRIEEVLAMDEALGPLIASSQSAALTERTDITEDDGG